MRDQDQPRREYISEPRPDLMKGQGLALRALDEGVGFRVLGPDSWASPYLTSFKLWFTWKMVSKLPYHQVFNILYDVWGLKIRTLSVLIPRL